uniref:Methyl-accepting transducer domain-containing protein n=1 Tax=Bracon brevicornis TaxID=1563983 RepID=A0A6V7KGK5_9HYME
MGEIISSVTRVTDIMVEIASASDEQSKGIGQVGQVVTEMDRVTQQNSALVEESAAAEAALEQQVIGLNQAVAVFQLPATGGRSRIASATVDTTTRPVLLPTASADSKKKAGAVASDNWETF